MNIPTGFLDSSGSVPFSLPERDPQGDDPVAKRISHNLQRLRDKRQLSLEALAHASGVRRAMIAQIEAGRSFLGQGAEQSRRRTESVHRRVPRPRRRRHGYTPRPAPEHAAPW